MSKNQLRRIFGGGLGLVWQKGIKIRAFERGFRKPSKVTFLTLLSKGQQNLPLGRDAFEGLKVQSY